MNFYTLKHKSSGSTMTIKADSYQDAVYKLRLLVDDVEDWTIISVSKE
jgi:hypothetical protein